VHNRSWQSRLRTVHFVWFVLSVKQNVRVYNFAFCFYGCETWSLKLREERRLGVLENRLLRRIFGPKWDKVTKEWRKLHNEELNVPYC